MGVTQEEKENGCVPRPISRAGHGHYALRVYLRVETKGKTVRMGEGVVLRKAAGSRTLIMVALS